MRGYLHHLTPKISVHVIAGASLLKGRKSSVLTLFSLLPVRSKKLRKYNAVKMMRSLKK
jgi:hypothetical protein